MRCCFFRVIQYPSFARINHRILPDVINGSNFMPTESKTLTEQRVRKERALPGVSFSLPNWKANYCGPIKSSKPGAKR
jgi:hypothetical protein